MTAAANGGTTGANGRTSGTDSDTAGANRRTSGTDSDTAGANRRTSGTDSDTAGANRRTARPGRGTVAVRGLRAEWTKLRTLPSSVWSAVAVAGLLAGGAAAVVLITDVPGCAGERQGCPGRDTATLLLSGVHFAQVAAVALAVAVMCGEYHPRLLRVTLAMRPGRTTVFAVKAAITVATVLVAAVLGGAAVLLAGPAMLSARGLTPEVGYPAADLAAPLVRAAGGTALYLALVALLSLGLAATIRQAGAAIGATMTLLYGPYLVTLLVPMPAGALDRVQNAAPMTAGLAIQSTVPGTGTASLSPWAGLVVLTAYAAASLLCGAVLFLRRDA